MLTEKSRQALKQIKHGAVVRFQVLDFKTELPALMAADSLALRAQGHPADSHGSHAGAEVWLINTKWSPACQRILEASTLRYKLLTRSV